MIIRNVVLKDYEDIILLYNNNIEEYKPLNKELFTSIINHQDFKQNHQLVAIVDDKIVGVIFSHTRKINQSIAYISLFIVDKKHRRCKIGTKLIEEIRQLNPQKILKFSYEGRINLPWLIENTSHEHPGAPGVMVNSELYLFLLNNGFEVIDHQDAFHLDMNRYVENPNLYQLEHDLMKEDISIQIYDPKIHKGLDDFLLDINDEGFEKVIVDNLKKDQPQPFYVVTKNNKIYGWTGALYTEENDRQHFDGIIISSSIRGKGIGKLLFNKLALFAKKSTAKYMTFFTGRTNHARYIYLGLGFLIVKTFAIMEKR